MAQCTSHTATHHTNHITPHGTAQSTNFITTHYPIHSDTIYTTFINTHLLLIGLFKVLHKAIILILI